jgi:hypothetical protein
MNREVGLVVASVVLIVGAAAYHLRQTGSMRPARSSAPAERAALAPSPRAGATEGRSQVRMERTALAEPETWGRNPFLTVEEASGAKGWRPADQVEVKAIIVGQRRGVASLNGQSVVVGDKVGEETVRDIQQDAIVLERDGRQRVIRVHQPAIAIEVREGKR